jgi:TLC domain
MISFYSFELRYLNLFVACFQFSQHVHPILENETNRLILARHIGTDFFCCATVGWLGLSSFRTVCPDFLSAALRNPGAMPKAGFEARMFMHQPAAFQICLFFTSYQIKNLFDTILWNDGPEFIAHHIMCMFVAYGTLFHGIAHFHAPFYFGISEISTAILCLLANFDDAHGVPGLADAFPQGKVVLGALFAVAFIVCRVFLWVFFSYYFVTDALLAINKTDSSRDAARPWVKIFLGSLTGLSVLQVIWLGQIIMVGMEEYQKMTA